ncbi:hypothetical protein BDQ94DRAFT_152405 [Aspergillus welwitschiae]|uniref:Uncharacterized protein n=1 Tax=Aspergillus welwitschiae TaxID=1341132 RepID=A0A3F3PMW6_9EURO|nr:hypothetical protein BDQ94DRAFT_152405 [Aspergillus welwitschiae]RDH28254.1 hypothetical protein BDQ94DRAFT_152405 [Aspergillus welwitschiae]
MGFFFLLFDHLLISLRLIFTQYRGIPCLELSFLSATARCASPSKATGRLLRQYRSNTVHMISAVTDGTIHRVIACGVQATALAGLHGTGEFLSSSNLNQDELPALVQNLFDVTRDVNDLACWDYVVVAVDVSVKHLVVPETIPGLAVGVEVGNLRQVLDLAFSA